MQTSTAFFYSVAILVVMFVLAAVGFSPDFSFEVSEGLKAAARVGFFLILFLLVLSLVVPLFFVHKATRK